MHYTYKLNVNTFNKVKEAQTHYMSLKRVLRNYIKNDQQQQNELPFKEYTVFNSSNNNTTTVTPCCKSNDTSRNVVYDCGGQSNSSVALLRNYSTKNNINIHNNYNNNILQRKISTIRFNKRKQQQTASFKLYTNIHHKLKQNISKLINDNQILSTQDERNKFTQKYILNKLSDCNSRNIHSLDKKFNITKSYRNINKSASTPHIVHSYVPLQKTLYNELNMCNTNTKKVHSIMKKKLNDKIISSIGNDNVTLVKEFPNVIKKSLYTKRKKITICNDDMILSTYNKYIELTSQIQMKSNQTNNTQKNKTFKDKLYRVLLSIIAHFNRMDNSNISKFYKDTYNINNTLPFIQTEYTQLIRAINVNEYFIVKNILDKHPLLTHAVDDFNQTALHIASKRNRSKIISLLLNKGANIDAKDESGRTALHNASMYNMRDNIKILLFEHANPFIKDNKGNLPLHYAKNEIIKFLLQRTMALIHVNLQPNIRASMMRIRVGITFYLGLTDEEIHSMLLRY